MVRINRKEINHENLCYHIIVRGVEGVNIFKEDQDRLEFLQLLAKTCKDFKISIFSYILMDTHFHLLLKTEEANLSEAMHFLNSSYAHWYNLKWVRKGHLLQDRYKSHLILNFLYLYTVASYLALNPVEAGLVDSPEKYPWSSFLYFYPSSDSGKISPSWLKIDEFLNLCQTDRKNFINFVEKNKQKLVNKKNRENLEINYLNHLSDQTTNQKLLDSSLDINNFLQLVKKRLGSIEDNKRLKHLIIYILIKEGFSTNTIAKALNLSRQGIFTIYKRIQKNLQTDNFYRILLQHTQNRLFSQK
ncbi:MAG: transposase [Candidatus Caldatribacteriota bacterium]